MIPTPNFTNSGYNLTDQTYCHTPLERSKSINYTNDSTPTTPLNKSYTVIRPQEINPAYKYDTNDSPDSRIVKVLAIAHGNIITPEKKSDVIVNDLKPCSKTLKLAKDEAFKIFCSGQGRSGVYRWRVGLNNRLIGESSNIPNRFSQYLTKMRKHSSKSKPFIKDAAKSASENETNFGIIYPNFGTTEHRLKLEKILINHYKSITPNNLYNERNGGGGGRERKPLSHQDITAIHEVACNVLKIKETNKLNDLFLKPIDFSVHVESKNVYVDTKHEDLQKKGALYVYHNTVKDKYYVGKAHKEVKKRISSELSEANTGNSTSVWQKELKENPENFKLHIVYQTPEGMEHIIEEIEHIYIRALDSYNTGYNGTTSSQRLQSLKGKNEQEEKLLVDLRNVLHKINPKPKNRKQKNPKQKK